MDAGSALARCPGRPPASINNVSSFGHTYSSDVNTSFSFIVSETTSYLYSYILGSHLLITYTNDPIWYCHLVLNASLLNYILPDCSHFISPSYALAS
jgi:hypothetical protein